MLKLWLLVAAFCSTSLAGAAPTVRASPVANLIYQLDCVSLRIKTCGNRDGYVALWQMRFGIDVARDADVAVWANLKARLPQNEGGSSASSDPSLLRTTSFDAADVNEYLARIRLYLEPADWERARSIVLRVRPAFEEWWKERAQAPLARHVVMLREGLQSGGIAQEMARLHAFFGLADDASAELSLHLVRRVTPTQRSSAEQIGRYAVLEIDDDGSAAQGLPVAVHEYSHFLFSRMSKARFQRVRNNILGISTARPSMDRLGAWNLFNEALATAIGNGRVGRTIDAADFAARMSTRGGLYLEPNVDAAAKALLPILDRTLERGQAVDEPSFAEDYVAALTASLGAAIRGPQVTLQELALFVDSSLSNRDDVFVPAITRLLPMNHSLWSYRVECCGQEYARWWMSHAKEQPRLAIVRTAQRADAAALCDDVQPNKTGYSIRIVNGLPCIVVAVDDVSQVEPAVVRIAGMSELGPGDYE